MCAELLILFETLRKFLLLFRGRLRHFEMDSESLLVQELFLICESLKTGRSVESVDQRVRIAMKNSKCLEVCANIITDPHRFVTISMDAFYLRFLCSKILHLYVRESWATIPVDGARQTLKAVMIERRSFLFNCPFKLSCFPSLDYNECNI